MKGKIIIAGAGPGDPELLTLKTAKYLQQADVVLADRLVSPEILEEYVQPGAEVILVGKEGRSGKSVSQKQINALLLEHYAEDKLVVRLKGGDVAFYANVLDELQTLEEYNIPYEIVPGITAAAGASAYAGIPLTARGYADSVRFLTHFGKQHKDESYWAELAATDDTLVFYMSGEALRELAGNLIRHNISEEKAIAVIEQATTPYQKVFIHQFDEFANIGKHSFVSPTLIIIGRVANLHHEYGWKANSRYEGSYFVTAAEQGEEREGVKLAEVY